MIERKHVVLIKRVARAKWQNNLILFESSEIHVTQVSLNIFSFWPEWINRFGVYTKFFYILLYYFWTLQALNFSSTVLIWLLFSSIYNNFIWQKAKKRKKKNRFLFCVQKFATKTFLWCKKKRIFNHFVSARHVTWVTQFHMRNYICLIF